jgi:hypothetical protein
LTAHQVVRAKIEAVMGCIALVFSPFVLPLALVDLSAALVAALGIAAAAGSATAIQLCFRLLDDDLDQLNDIDIPCGLEDALIVPLGIRIFDDAAQPVMLAKKQGVERGRVDGRVRAFAAKCEQRRLPSRR